MFPNAKGRSMSEGTMRDIMHNAIKEVGLQPPRKNKPIDRDVRSLHGLRYTFAIRAIEVRMEYDTVEAIVGHRTLAMAIKYTEKRRKSRLAGAKLNDALKQDREHRLTHPSQFTLVRDSLLSATNRIETVNVSVGEPERDGITASSSSPLQTVRPTDPSTARQVGASTPSSAENASGIVMNQPPFYECGVCGFFHPGGWDCAVENRFTPEELDEQYEDDGWVEIDPPVTAPEPETGQ